MYTYTSPLTEQIHAYLNLYYVPRIQTYICAFTLIHIQTLCACRQPWVGVRACLSGLGVICHVCLGCLSFLPTSYIASVLCTCISMYMLYMSCGQFNSNRAQRGSACFAHESLHSTYMYLKLSVYMYITNVHIKFVPRARVYYLHIQGLYQLCLWWYTCQFPSVWLLTPPKTCEIHYKLVIIIHTCSRVMHTYINTLHVLVRNCTCIYTKWLNAYEILTEIAWDPPQEQVCSLVSLVAL